MRYRRGTERGGQGRETPPSDSRPLISSSMSRMGDWVVEVAEIAVAAIYLVRRIKSLLRTPRRELTGARDLSPAVEGGGEKHA